MSQVDATVKPNKRLDALKAAADRLMTSDIVKDMPGFTVPLQERTRRKTSEIVAVAAYILQTHPFSDMTMDTIATAVGCSVPSIYARFDNKEALLPAIHLLTIEETRTTLDREIFLERFLGKNLRYFSDVFVDIIFQYFVENENFVRAAVICKATAVHLQLQNLIPVLTARLNKIVPILMKRDADVTRPAIQFGIHVLISLLRDATVVWIEPRVYDKAALADIFTTIVEHKTRANTD